MSILETMPRDINPSLDSIGCPFCKGKSACSTRDMHTDAAVAYELFWCRVCDIQFWTPLRNPGASWYERDERYASRNSRPILLPNKKQVDCLAAMPVPTGRVLDVGCGVGNFLAHATKKGWAGWGIDFDADAVEAGKKTFGLEHLEVSDIAAFRTTHPGVFFDAITFFDVLEHVDAHEEFMKDVKTLLAPRGCVALSVPYRASWRWLLPHDLPPRHLTRWNENALSLFFERYGFKPIMVRRLPASFEYIVMKLRFAYGMTFSIGLVSRVQDATAASGGRESRGLRSRVLMRLAGFAAKTKDYVLFGIPAAIIWLCLLPFRARYTDLYAVFQATEAGRR